MPLQVVHRDEHLIIVDKPPGVPVQPDRTGDPCLLEMVRTVVPKHEVGSPHRLDRPVSGLVVFALDRDALLGMDGVFRRQEIAKSYLAIVEGKPAAEAELVHKIHHHGGSRKAQVEAADGMGGPGVVRLHYRLRAAGIRYSLLEVSPVGGAFHQIRAQLGAIGHPIKGDVKYGARRGEKDRSIGLHAWKLVFDHPITGARLQIEAPIPGHGSWPVFKGLL